MRLKFFALIGALVFGPPLAAQSPLDAELDAAKAPMPGTDVGHEDPALIEIRVGAINQELASLKGKHDWAGEYYFGDGLGANLKLHIAPQTGFAVTWHGCMGLYGANEGQVKLEPDGVLALDFRWKNLIGGFGQFPRRVLPVRWGERHYLVDADRIIEFINSIHQGMEPRGNTLGMHFLRKGDEELAVTGFPTLPPVWLGQLRTEARVYVVEAVEPVTVPGKNGSPCVQQARLLLAPAPPLSAVSAELMPGLELEPAEAADGIRDIEVTSSERGVIQASWQRIFNDCTYDDRPPAVGMRMSTGAYRPE